MVVQMSLADLLLQFLLPYKGAANFKTDKRHICSCVFKKSHDRNSLQLLERTPMHDSTAIGHNLRNKCKMLGSSVLFFGRIYTTESFSSTAPSLDGVSKIYTWWIQMFFLPSRGEFLFFDSIGFISSQILKWPIPVSFDVSFLFDLKFEFLSRCWTWNWRGDFWVSVFVFFFIHILTSMNRALIGMWRLTIRVRVTLFFLLKEVINLYVLLKMALNDKLIFYKFVIPQKPFYIC